MQCRFCICSRDVEGAVPYQRNLDLVHRHTYKQEFISLFIIFKSAFISEKVTSVLFSSRKQVDFSAKIYYYMDEFAKPRIQK